MRHWLGHRLYCKARKSGLHYLKLPLQCDVEGIQREVELVNDRFVAHRPEISKKWYGLTLHGLDSSKTEDARQYGLESGDFADSTKMNWTKASKYTPLIRQFVESLKIERLARVRIMKLEPGGEIHPHRDSKTPALGNSINVSITEPNGCIWGFSDGMTVPFRPGAAFDIDISKTHFVRNAGSLPRYHLIIHPFYHGRYSQMLAKAYLNHSLRKGLFR